jgi:ABC-type phosphate/phosphonate transport system substrate-binding protein
MTTTRGQGSLTEHHATPLQQRLRLALALPLLLMALGLVGIGTKAATAAEPQDGLPKVLRTGFLATIYHDIDPRDAKAATELLAKEISRNMGLTTTPDIIIFAKLSDLSAAIRRNELGMVSMPTLDYLRIRDTIPLVPVVVGAHNGGRGTSYVLVARRNSTVKTFTDLKGKSLLLPPSTKHEASRLWLELQVTRVRGGTPTSFFSSMREFPKVSQAIMAVFFKQADAALVTRAAYDTSTLLNPQIGRDLGVIAESEYFSDGITCFPTTLSKSAQAIIAAAIAKLNATTTGRQLYTVFQTSGTTPFKPAYLEGLEKLLRERSQLQSPVTKRSYHGTSH